MVPIEIIYYFFCLFVCLYRPRIQQDETRRFLLNFKNKQHKNTKHIQLLAPFETRIPK